MGRVPEADLDQAAAVAEAKVLQNGEVLWRRVSGPAAAFVATLARLGWRRAGGSTLLDDVGRTIELSLDPPAVIKRRV